MLIHCYDCGVQFDLEMGKSAYKFSQKDVYCTECAAKVKDWRFIRMKKK